MSELSLVKRGGGGAKIQVLTGTSNGKTLTVSGVKINPTRIYAFVSTGTANGYIASLVKSGSLNYFTVHYNSSNDSVTTTLSGETLTIRNSSYPFSGNYQVTLIED